MSHIYYNPLLPLTDIVRLCIIFGLWYYVKKIESINCPITPSWKPVYIKFYAVVSIILLLLGLMHEPSVDISMLNIVINGLLNIILIYAVFSYIREIEDSFKSCELSKLDLDFHLVHEFLKLYSLVIVLLLISFVLLLTSIGVSLFPIPKYIATQNLINQAATSYKSSSNKKHKTKKSRA